MSGFYSEINILRGKEKLQNFGNGTIRHIEADTLPHVDITIQKYISGLRLEAVQNLFERSIFQMNGYGFS